MKIQPNLFWLRFWVLVSLCFNSALWAQEGAEQKTAEREKTIYVPFSKLREVFEKEGRGVFLPYEEFQKLWNAANEPEPIRPAGPPVNSIITEARSEAMVLGDVVQVEAVLTVELLKKGWNIVPLRLQGAAIQSAETEGQPARITATDDGGYQLLFENNTDESKRIEVKLSYARAYNKSPGQNSVGFAAPLAPVNRWKIRIAEAGVKVNVNPMIAASEEDSGPREGVSAEQANKQNEASKNETVLLAFVGSAPEVTISWTPKSEGATGMTALTSVQTQQEVSIAEGAIRTRATLTYSISRAQLDSLAVEIPLDQKVVNVFDPNVRKWEVDTSDGKTQRITVQLFEPATTTQKLTIEVEKFIDEADLKEVHSPMFNVVDVARQQGIVVVSVDPALRAESTVRNNLLQLDATELPPELANRSWAFAYRYAAMPYDLGLALEKIKPRIDVDQLVECYLEPELISLDLLAVYTITQAGIFNLEANLPNGYEVLQVRGLDVAGAAAVAIDSFHTEGEDTKKLIVNLARKAFGKVAIQVRLQKRISDPNLIAPTGNASTLDIGIPEAKQEFVKIFNGKLVIYSPESLRLSVTGSSGLRAIGFNEALTSLPSCRENRFATTRPSLSFAYTDQPTQLQLSAERRSPYVTARQIMIVRVDSGVVKYESQIYFEVLYSGVKSLRVDLPSASADEIRNRSGLREAVMEPQPSDVNEGYVAWSFAGEAELLGMHQVRLTWGKKMDELAVGSSVDVEVPTLRPANVDRAWGQVVVMKTESLDIEPTGTPEGLRPIDPTQDVMPEAQSGNIAQAFEFVDDWSLMLKATRYQLEEVKRTSIERGLVRTVITRSNQRSVQALYRIRSARQRLAIKLPKEAAFDSQPARVNGNPIAIERGDQDLLYIPLVGQDPNTDLVLDLRYTLPGNYRNLDVPEFPEDPAVQKVYLAAFLPKELSLMTTSGPWTDEYKWQRGDGWRWVPVPNSSDEALVSWVVQGISLSNVPAFQKDGTLYLFSALRPAAPPDGNLHLNVLHENTLGVLLFIALILVALVFLRSLFSTKLAIIAALFALAIACGVFVPTLGQQLLNRPTYAGLGILAIAWSAWGVGNYVKSWKNFRMGSTSNIAAPSEPGAASNVDQPSEPHAGSSDKAAESEGSTTSEADSSADDDANKKGGSNG